MALKTHNISKEDLWQKRVQDFKNSGLIQSAWARQHNLKQRTLSYWVKKFNLSQSQATEPQFLEVHIPEASSSQSNPITIHAGNLHVDISEHCSTSLLTNLIEALHHHA